ELADREERQHRGATHAVPREKGAETLDARLVAVAHRRLRDALHLPRLREGAFRTVLEEDRVLLLGPGREVGQEVVTAVPLGQGSSGRKVMGSPFRISSAGVSAMRRASRRVRFHASRKRLKTIPWNHWPGVPRAGSWFSQ